MKRVLVIDDQPDLRKLVKWSLEMLQQAAEVFEAADGPAGIALAREVHPDLVVLDVMMPGSLTGLQACERLRADPSFRDTPIVLLSACGQLADVRQGLAAGASAYVVKPFSPLRLLETVEQLLSPGKTVSQLHEKST